MGRERSEVRGWDDDDPIDYEVGQRPTYYPAKQFSPAPTQQQLIARPFVSDPLATPRCWCGRPIKDSTGSCLLSHVWQHTP
jgi:hypothetical protein